MYDGHSMEVLLCSSEPQLTHKVEVCRHDVPIVLHSGGPHVRRWVRCWPAHIAQQGVSLHLAWWWPNWRPREHCVIWLKQINSVIVRRFLCTSNPPEGIVNVVPSYNREHH